MATRCRLRLLFCGFICFFLFLFLNFSNSASTPNSELIPGIDYVSGEIFVCFKESYMPETGAISIDSGTFGIPYIDKYLSQLNARKFKRFLTSYNKCRSDAGKQLERTFLIEFPADVNTTMIVEQMSQMPHFEYVELNRILEKIYYSTRRCDLSAGTELNKQWNLDYYKDKIDIDAPEAWAIERGDTSVVIVINDSGAMIDTCTGSSCDAGNWTIHNDFYHYWIEEEDSNSTGVLNRYDIDQTDNNNDGAKDNIIGYNFAPGYEADTTSAGDPTYQLAFWHSMPWAMMLVRASPEEADSWACLGYNTHGTKVASIALAKDEGANIVGVANKCKVYWVRAGFSRNPSASIDDEIRAIYHSAIYGDVINMSWGFRDNPGTVSCQHE